MAANISDLRHRITIQSFTKVADGQGGYTTTWADVKTVWAKIENVTGVEKVFAQRLDTNYDHKITIRYTTGISPKMRIVFDSRIFQIHSVSKVDERRWFTEILAIEGVGS